MLKSEITTIRHEDGSIQRIQVVTADSWDDLDFMVPDFCDRAFTQYANIYQNFLVGPYPNEFGRNLLFHLPKDISFPYAASSRAFGALTDPQLSAAALLRAGLKISRGDEPVFRHEKAKLLYEKLEQENFSEIISGTHPFTKIIPVCDAPGFLSEMEPEAALKCDASFFLMDPFDIVSPYDQVGTVFGLLVKDGVILNPPLYEREALVVRKGKPAEILVPHLEDLQIEINGKIYDPSNAKIHTRPAHRRTPLTNGTDLVIVGRKVVAVKKGGGTVIPTGGFVLTVKENGIRPETLVSYHGMEDVAFAIQAGNSAVLNGAPVTAFMSKYYNFRNPLATAFPPSIYPRDFEKGRAARLVLGEDFEGHPVFLWIEGAGKVHYVKGEDSTGASLLEAGSICRNAGMKNGIHLDGGGSAQILLSNKRSLKICDRDPATNEERERAVPLGIIIH